MADPEFYPAPTPLDFATIADLTGADLAGDCNTAKTICGIAALGGAGPDDLTFFDNGRFADALSKTRAGACLCSSAHVDLVPSTTQALVVGRPHHAFATVAAILYPSAVRPMPVLDDEGISSAANVHRDARIEPGAIVEAGSVVGARAEIGEGSVISAGCVIGPDVRIGRNVSIGPLAVVKFAMIGDRVVIHAGVCVGQDGFGFIIGRQEHTKVVQVGRVIVQDDVEIGANSAIDRGSIRDTVIGAGTKIDNLVQIGHNVVIGRNCLIAGQVGISGSVTIGDNTILGGQVGVRDNVTIGRDAVIAATSAVGTDVPDNARWGGTPARPIKDWLRENAALRRLTTRQGNAREKEASKE